MANPNATASSGTTRKNITKRTRYEVLNRDGFACQYCGAKAPDVELHIDHVIPVALGGGNSPGNLVAACKDCNAGKGSANPDSQLVERLSAEAATYALAMANKAATIAQRIVDEREYLDRFYDYWAAEAGERHVDPDWKASARRWHGMGVPIELLEHSIDVTVERKDRYGAGLPPAAMFRYMAGVVYTTLKQEDVSYTLGDQKVRLYTEDEYEEYGAREWLSARDSTRARQAYTDLLARHIDKQAAVGGYAKYDHLCSRSEMDA